MSIEKEAQDLYPSLNLNDLGEGGRVKGSSANEETEKESKIFRVVRNLFVYRVSSENCFS